MENRKMRAIIALMMAAVMALMAAGLTACGSKEEAPAEPAQEEEPAEDVSTGPELSEDQMDDLFQQAAEKTLQIQYSDYMPDKLFGHAETFNISREGDKGVWDVYLTTGEYVAIDGKAYLASGGNGEAILKFDYTADGPKLTEVVWSADGSDHDDWIKENFSEEGLKNWETFLKNEKAVDELNEILDQKASDGLGVPVDTENTLQIDDNEGTYEIFKTIESGDPADDTYKFDTETVKKGKLEDLKK